MEFLTKLLQQMLMDWECKRDFHNISNFSNRQLMSLHPILYITSYRNQQSFPQALQKQQLRTKLQKMRQEGRRESARLNIVILRTATSTPREAQIIVLATEVVKDVREMAARLVLEDLRSIASCMEEENDVLLRAATSQPLEQHHLALDMEEEKDALASTAIKLLKDLQTFVSDIN